LLDAVRRAARRGSDGALLAPQRVDVVLEPRPGRSARASPVLQPVDPAADRLQPLVDGGPGQLRLRSS
jgi:hypothetical protein